MSSFSKSYNKRQQISVAGKKYLVGALTAGLLTYKIAPSIASRLSNIADNFEFYRFVKLRWRQHPNNSATGVNANDQIVAYFPEETSTAFTFAGLTEQTYSTIICSNPNASSATSSTTIPSNWVEVPRSVLLATAVKWFKTSGAGTEDDFVIQGEFLIASASTADTSNNLIEVEYICEFAGAEPASLQP
jgi:hypothetical protein